jgi:transposase
MRTSVESYPMAAVERAMKVQEVIFWAMARKLTWFQAAEIIGISDRQMRRWRERYEEHGYDGLMDRRRGVPSSGNVQHQHPGTQLLERTMGMTTCADARLPPVSQTYQKNQMSVLQG